MQEKNLFLLLFCLIISVTSETSLYEEAENGDSDLIERLISEGNFPPFWSCSISQRLLCRRQSGRSQRVL